jgi:hypothetical protein
MAAPIIIDDAEVERALADDKVCARIMAKQLRPQAGDLVGVRLNLNIFKSRGVPVQTLHKGSGSGRHRQNSGFYGGTVLWYQKIVSLRDCYLNVAQSGREKIASGTESKHPIASADGILMDETAHSFGGMEVRFNPYDTHLFLGPDNRAVRWAEEVTVYAHRVYCRGKIIYHNEATAPPKAGPSPSIAILS